MYICLLYKDIFFSVNMDFFLFLRDASGRQAKIRPKSLFINAFPA